MFRQNSCHPEGIPFGHCEERSDVAIPEQIDCHALKSRARNDTKIVSLVTLMSLFAVTTFAEELKDIKSPVEYPASNSFIIIFILVIVIFNLAGYFFWKKRVSRDKKDQIMTPRDIALRDLKELDKKSFLQQGRPDSYYAELSDILRKYIEQRFGIKAPEMTTDEFMISLKDSDKFDKKNAELLKGFLSLADLVKFAKYTISKDDAVKSFEEVLLFVNQTKESTN